MTDEFQQTMPESLSGSPQISTDILAPQPKKSNKWLWIIIGITSLAICLCSILCIVAIVSGVVGTMSEKAPIQSVLDAFMTHMAAKDTENAYSLFSPRAQRQFAITGIEELVTGNNYVLFEGYQSLNVTTLKVNASANSDPNAPQGTVANIEGSVSYTGGFNGQITAVLEKVDGAWKIHRVNITVPPNKFQP